MSLLSTRYRRKLEQVLVPTATNLQLLLAGHLKRARRIDRISVRAKGLERFLEKADKREDGKKLYTDPLNEIQDQIGARVIVFYTSDVQPVIDTVMKYFSSIEQLWKEPVSDKEFGYFGRHLMLALPQDCVPEGISLRRAPEFFELQVRTLFQHAWSEASHDLAYKPKKPLTSDHNRRFAFTAAQAWGADMLFEELSAELGGEVASSDLEIEGADASVPPRNEVSPAAKPKRLPGARKAKRA